MTELKQNAAPLSDIAGGDERWAYRRTATSRILDAVVGMIMRKSARVEGFRR